MHDDAPTTPTITDPSRIRALAHPLRLELLEFIGDVGEATATQCAEHTGETVANCSFHLRTLAKAGFIEPAPSRGREKPWRAAARSRRLDVDPADPASLTAMTELVGLMVGREAERFRSFVADEPRQPEAWRDTVSVTTSAFWATAEEMRELVRELATITDRFAGRIQDPSLRPEGARLGRLFATVNPDSYPDEAADTAPRTTPTHETTEDRP